MLDRLLALKREAVSRWQIRVLSQLEYVHKMWETGFIEDMSPISRAIGMLWDARETNGALTDADCQDAEAALLPLSAIAKMHEVICVAHAHIDMNWRWDFSETVAITLDTFRTMLHMLEIYPTLTFSQSQASCYEIVRKYDRAMFERIKRMIHEGRWEVTASAWVEADKNMPCAESQFRHIEHTKRFFEKHMGVPPDSLTIDFEPDTFGHHENVPEILSRSGIKYYYFCRGYNGLDVFRWVAPSGAEILAYREPFWYGGVPISPESLLFAPEFCQRNGVDTSLKVYGIGNHGGGPTRRDIERLIDMSGWPVYPKIRFGAYKEFFEILDRDRDRFPALRQELNPLFDGCYTTHTRVKTANKLAENRLIMAETAAAVTGTVMDGELMGEAWEKTLFNHFHDIITGSGVRATVEYAVSEYQKVMATANTGLFSAMREVSSKINTSAACDVPELAQTVSEGGGVGYDIATGRVSGPEIGAGPVRYYNVFNFSAQARSEVVRITLWDWYYDERRLSAYGPDGKPVPVQVLPVSWPSHVDKRRQHYEGHDFLEILIWAEVPAYGYRVYRIQEEPKQKVDIPEFPMPRHAQPREYVLRNEKVTAAFDPMSFSLISLRDSLGNEYLSGGGAGFRIVDERDEGISAWLVGEHMSQMRLSGEAVMSGFHIGELCSWLEYWTNFRGSVLRVKIMLYRGADHLVYDAQCDWRECARPGISLPQLNFAAQLAMPASEYLYGVPGGVIARKPAAMDMPSSAGFIAAGGLQLMCGSRYGFRGNENELSVTLARSSRDPDPLPEYGQIPFQIALGIARNDGNLSLLSRCSRFENPMSYVPVRAQEGILPLENRFLEISGIGVHVLSVRPCPADDGISVRLVEVEGRDSEVSVSYPSGGKSIATVIPRYAIRTVELHSE